MGEMGEHEGMREQGRIESESSSNPNDTAGRLDKTC